MGKLEIVDERNCFLDLAAQVAGREVSFAELALLLATSSKLRAELRVAASEFMTSALESSQPTGTSGEPRTCAPPSRRLASDIASKERQEMAEEFDRALAAGQPRAGLFASIGAKHLLQRHVAKKLILQHSRSSAPRRPKP